MATETTNYKLVKDAPNENYDIAKVNANLDKIDTALKTNADASLEVANNLTETVAGKALDATQGRLLNDDLVSHKAENVHQHEELKFSELSSIATSVDDDGLYKNIEWKRKDDTIYAKSSLLGASPYTQIKIDYYDDLGLSIIKNITWDLSYDENEFIYKKEVI